MIMKRITKFYGLTIIVSAIILSFIVTSSQEQDARRVVIDGIVVNDNSNYTKEFSDIVISSKDSIIINYHCQSTGELTPFIFRITIKNEKESYSRTLNTRTVTYNNLPEGTYDFIIEAFDPKSDWKAAPGLVQFRVNNREASVRKELSDLRNKIKADTAKIATAPNPSSGKGLDFISMMIGLLIGSGCFGIIITVINSQKKGKSDEEQKPETNKKFSRNNYMQEKNSVSIPKDQHDQMLMENSNLRAEISALRGQIDAMQTRTEELRKQNIELKDTSERLLKSQGEFEELQKQKDDLFAIIIHDIKNPAALIKSLVDLLRSYDLTATEQKEIIEDIFETTAKIVSLSQQVSRILSLESSSIRLDFEQVQINEIVKDVQRRNTIASQNKSIEVMLDLQQELPEVLIDPQKIDEVLDNLLSNAIKFSQKGGKVRLLTKLSDDEIVVEISDNGLGLSEEDIRLAFQQGSRLSAKPTGGETSSGFGLWVVKKLVEAHHGKVWVKSVLGKGSTFAFSLPYRLAGNMDEGI
jgi:signal transduction histidine kinase